MVELLLRLVQGNGPSMWGLQRWDCKRTQLGFTRTGRPWRGMQGLQTQILSSLYAQVYPVGKHGYLEETGADWAVPVAVS